MGCCLALGCQRRLSYHGRALVLNSLGLSTFWYLASFLTMSSTVKKAVSSTAFSFIWNGKCERVARSSLTQPSSSGGLNVVDLNNKTSAFHVIWVRRLAQAPDHPSFFFSSRALRVAFAGRSLQQILLLPAPSPTAMNLLPPFFCSVMLAWFRLSRRLENGNIVVDGSGSVVPLASLSICFAYRQFSRLALRLTTLAHRPWCPSNRRSSDLFWSTNPPVLPLWSSREPDPSARQVSCCQTPPHLVPVLGLQRCSSPGPSDYIADPSWVRQVGQDSTSFPVPPRYHPSPPVDRSECLPFRWFAGGV